MMWAIIIGCFLFISLISNIIRGNDDYRYHNRYRHPPYHDSLDRYGYGRVKPPYDPYSQEPMYSPDRHYIWDPYTHRWVRHPRGSGWLGTIISLVLAVALIYYFMRD